MKRLQNIKIALGCRMPCRHHSNVDAPKATYVDLIRTLVKCALDNSWTSYEYDPDEGWFHGQFHKFDHLLVIWQITPGFNSCRVKSYTAGNSVENAKLQEALAFCNGWTSSSNSSEAYIDRVSEELVIETELDFGDEVSKDFIKRSLLTDLFNFHIAFFEEALERNLIENNLWIADLPEQ